MRWKGDAGNPFYPGEVRARIGEGGVVIPKKNALSTGKREISTRVREEHEAQGRRTPRYGGRRMVSREG
jgi:hypothetical protein